MDRRSFIKGSAVALSASVVSASLGYAVSEINDDSTKNGSSQTLEPFFGKHQSGIATKPQEHAMWVALNMHENVTRDKLQRLMRLWTADSALLTSNSATMGDNESSLVISAHRLTITFGISYAGLKHIGQESSWAWEIKDLPRFNTDAKDMGWSTSDLVLQVCGEDKLQVNHAVRELITDAKPFATVAWLQTGFHSTSELTNGNTPRNLMGQKDGSANFVPEDPRFAETVWVNSGSWSTGSTMVIRRISMNLDTWEKLSPDLKNKVIGRDHHTGAPLGSTNEFATPDLEARDHHGLVIPADSHMRRARESGQRLHRRGYNYESISTDGVESGLVFVSFQADPQVFIDIQNRLSQMDSLNTWTTAIGSALYAVLPGCAEGATLGEGII